MSFILQYCNIETKLHLTSDVRQRYQGMSVVDDDAAVGCRLILAALQLKFKNNGIQSCSSKYANKIAKRYKGES